MSTYIIYVSLSRQETVLYCNNCSSFSYEISILLKIVDFCLGKGFVNGFKHY